MGVIIFIGLCIAVGILATKRNRGPIRWTLFSLIFTPLLGFIFILCLGEYRE